MKYEEILQHFEVTDVGRERDNNEDAYRVFDVIDDGVRQSDRGAMLVVADGMGGHSGGERASQIACETMADYFVEDVDAGTDADDAILNLLKDTILRANSKIQAEAKSNYKFYNMGTTLTAAVIRGEKILIGHVGDSRAYLFRNNQFVPNPETGTNFLTEDDTEVAELVKMGRLTPEQAATSKRRHILTQALGSERPMHVFTRSYGLKRGDVILLCSDGLYSMVPETEIAEVLKTTPESGLEQAARKLVSLANTNGGKDNITVIIGLI